MASIGAPNASTSILGGINYLTSNSCGLFIILGLLTRLAVLPTIIIMIVAISTTKIPILLERGFWPMAHEARTDWSMLLGSVFLLFVGAGRWSLDAWLIRSEVHHG